MRVLQVMAGADHGGAETFFVDMVIALHRAGLDQTVVIRRNAARAASLRASGIEPVELGFGGLMDLATGRRLARVIAEYRPDIVQSWMRRASRFVTHPPGAPGFVHVGWFGGYYPLGDYRACNHLVGVTDDIRAHQVAAGWPAERAHYIPTFAHHAQAAPLDRGLFDTPTEVPLFLALGRLHEKKGFDILIEALARLPGAHLWIAGEGELRGTLAAQIERLGLADRVKLLGWRDDRAALFAAADYCVMPSRYEPFGTVMIEAWAQKVPLVAAAAAGPKALIEDGSTGLLVDVDDVGGLAGAMDRLMNEPDLCRSLTAAARSVFDARFTEAAVTQQYLDFYRSITAS